MPYGYGGKDIFVDLSNMTTDIKPSRAIGNMLVGGRGVGQLALLEACSKIRDPYDPENILVFSAGPLVGTDIPGASRLSIDTVNAYTGGVGSSNVGGRFPYLLKKAGYDTLVITGKAERPVYISIINSAVRINDARHFWGKLVSTVDAELNRSIPGCGTLIIGPAGENRIKSACIISDGYRAAGRCGVGAIMGSKNLKALVVWGDKPVCVSQPEKLADLQRKLTEKIVNNSLLKAMAEYGTYAAVRQMNQDSRLPFRNFQDDYWQEDRINRVHPTVFGRYQQKRLGCPGCPVPCSALYIKDNHQCKGFNANLYWDYLSKLDIADIEFAMSAQELACDLGLDIDNSSGSLSWLMEAREWGVINPADFELEGLEWGNPNSVISLITDLAMRRGIGDLLADGTLCAAKALGNQSEELAIHIKGQDLAEAIRSSKGWALGVVVASRGGGHMNGAPLTESRKITPEQSLSWFGVATAGDPLAYKGKAEVVVWFERFKAVVDMLGVCYLLTVWEHPGLLNMEDLASAFIYATGLETGPDDLLSRGEYLCQVEKAINTIRCQWKRADDYPPPRFLNEPIKSGPFAGERLDPIEWNGMLDKYYALHGWDQNGRQTLNTLRKAGLGSCLSIANPRN